MDSNQSIRRVKKGKPFPDCKRESHREKKPQESIGFLGWVKPRQERRTVAGLSLENGEYPFN
jgi:hypothetical protein